jgi:hypothetical protein
MTGSSGNIETPGTITAGGFDVPPNPIVFNPANGATDVIDTVDIIITFDQLIQKGTGNITIRENSETGTILQTIAVSSGSVTISGSVLTIDPPSTLPDTTNIYVVVDAGAVTNISANKIINTYNFTTKTLALGDSYQGGFLICCASPTRWIVAPNTSQVLRTWYLRNDANTTAQQVSGCTGWFVPTRPQLSNPGFACRTFWDSTSTIYWSSTQSNTTHACFVRLDTGSASRLLKTSTAFVRAFRCVTY